MSITIPVFIASPGDVKPERKIVKSSIERLSPRLLRLFGVSLTPLDWQEFAPDAPPSSQIVFQDRLLDSIRPESLFIGIIHERIGTPIRSNTEITGTEAEYEYAINNRGKIRILTYLKKVKGDVSQLKVARLRNLIIDEARLPFQEYVDLLEFKNRIIMDIMETVLSMIFGSEAERRRQYCEFFRFGTRRGHNTSSVFIVYPPIHKHDTTVPNTRRVDYDWRSRLLPNVIYEDFKTIQKLEAALRLIGVQDYHSVTTPFPSVLTERGNRIWICIPRNPPAKHFMGELGDRIRFRFINKPDEKDGTLLRCIEWRTDNDNVILVKSPLAKYLSLTRPIKRQAWNPDFGNFYAKDYAVISRFKIEGRSCHPSRPFYHYFIAGIRGLGTWGAGWYIDRYPDRLEALSKESLTGDVQIILEVKYLNHRILSVTEVTDEDQIYFDRQYNDDYIVSKLDKMGFHKLTQKMKQKKPA